MKNNNLAKNDAKWMESKEAAVLYLNQIDKKQEKQEDILNLKNYIESWIRV